MKLFFSKTIHLLQSKEFSFSNPDVVHTILAIIFLAFALLHLLRVDRFKYWSWLVSPASSRQRDWLNSLGEKWYSRLMAVVFAAFGLLILYLTWYF
ncbi:hypothetical protein [Psychroserpens sp. NJDZ02]|uniref:hypothetical protein n=1 Tax=Psychroserpens sp. NJDZ02 TaxID=2570561 RepID=UPI0010A8BD2B|nr:hypothetical protein [Psychroserpens sp. NJDZ02]QCE43062.1 hypothetical protein E9099_17095 [Psychroserpens sp. NJDZ02]